MAPCLGIPISRSHPPGWFRLTGARRWRGEIAGAHRRRRFRVPEGVSWSSNSSFTFKNWRRLQRVEPFRLLLTCKQMRACKNQPTYHLKKWQPFERDWWTYCFLTTETIDCPIRNLAGHQPLWCPPSFPGLPPGACLAVSQNGKVPCPGRFDGSWSTMGGFTNTYNVSKAIGSTITNFAICMGGVSTNEKGVTWWGFTISNRAFIRLKDSLIGTWKKGWSWSIGAPENLQIQVFSVIFLAI